MKRIVATVILCALLLVLYAPLTSAEDIVKDKYAIIINTSTDTATSESTGLYYSENSVNNSETSIDANAYKKDYIKPFNKNIDLKAAASKANLNKQLNLTSYAVGDTRLFYTYNIKYGSYDTVSATLKSSGTKANVWVKTSDYNMSTTDADKIKNEFDNNIFTKISSVFGQSSDVDSNGKVNILCFDIQDGFPSSNGYVAGYFDPGDLYSNNSGNPYSNDMEVFYIDTYPAMGTGTTKDVTGCYDTLAHEFQHMVNWNQNIFIENNDPETGDMDIWLNEGLSEAASQVYSGQVSQDRISYYNSSNSIKNGSSLLKWDSTLENYSLSYLFMEYLKVQVGIGDSVFTEITQSTYNDYQCVEQVIKKYIDPNLTFKQFMTNFRTALLLKNSAGPYGFKGIPDYNTISSKIYTGSAVNLYGGGAIVIAADSSTNKINVPANKGADINYFIVTDLPRAVANNVAYNSSRTIYYFYGTGALNGNSFTSGKTVSAEGSYSLAITNGTITTINFTIDKTPPIITIGNYNTSSTNQSITVTAWANEGTLNSTNHTFSENGSFDFVATDLAGNSTTKTVEITNIDKTPPIIIIEPYSTETTNQSIIVRASTNEGTLNTTQHTFNENGSFDFIATDLAGNVTTKTVAIVNINITLPVITISSYNTALTNQSITVTASTNKGTLNVTSHTFYENGSFDFIATDLAGNSTTKTVNISNIVNYIRADITTDTKIDALDLLQLKKFLLDQVNLSDTEKLAADVTGDGKVDALDLLQLKKFLLGQVAL